MKHTNIFIVPLLLCFSITAIYSPVIAGTLGDFEKDATKHRSQKTSNNDENDYHSPFQNDHYEDDGISDPISDFLGFFETTGEISVAFVDSVWSSWTRLDYDTESTYQSKLISSRSLSKKETGESVIPYFRFDFHYQNQESDVYASDYRIVTGYGPWALMGRKTYLREEEPFTKLRIDQLYGVMRLTFDDHVELGLGFGEYKLVGSDTNSGFSFTAPLTIRFNKYISAEVIPTWTSINENEIEDYDVGVLLGINYISAKIGYRRIESPSQYLQGPYVGISLYY